MQRPAAPRPTVARPAVVGLPVASAPSDERRVIQGVLLMACGALTIPSIDIVAKVLGPGGGELGATLGPALPPLQIGWARFFFQILLVAPIAFAVVGWAVLRPRHLALVALRGLLIAVATVLFFWSIVFMAVAEAIAIFFVEPLILTLLSALVLGERIGWRRIAGVVVGFAGALLVIRPNFVEVGWPALLPIGTAICFAFYLLLTKLLADREHPLTLHLWAGITGAAVLTAALAAGLALGESEVAGGLVAAPIAPTPVQWALLALLGAVATFGHFLVVMAFRRAPASQLAPIQYLEIFAAALLGWIVFAEAPDQVAWIGIALIIGSGVFVLQRERVRAVEALGDSGETGAPQPTAEKSRAVSGL